MSVINLIPVSDSFFLRFTREWELAGSQGSHERSRGCVFLWYFQGRFRSCRISQVGFSHILMMHGVYDTFKDYSTKALDYSIVLQIVFFWYTQYPFGKTCFPLLKRSLNQFNKLFLTLRMMFEFVYLIDR